MQELARYWADDYDFRRFEKRLNAVPQFMTEIDGLDIHFIRVRSRHENALPLIITHGWPGSVIEMLTESGARAVDPELVRVEGTGVEADADWGSLWSPENYLGSERTENFASRNGFVLGTRHMYATPPVLLLNHWALSGDWTITPQSTVLNEAEGLIAYCFHARDLHLVMAPTSPAGPIRFRVRIDGRPPGAAQGADVDGSGHGTVTEPRLYQLIRQPGPVATRTFEITFLDPGVRAYAFTFG